MAKTILQPAGPARLREVMLNGQARKKEWDFGTAAHEKILNRGPKIVINDDHRNSNAYKDAKKKADAAGELVLKTEEAASVDAMAEAILANPLAGELLTAAAGQPEVSMFGTDEATGRWLRGRLDFLHSRELIVDYKTTASLDTFARDSWNFGYHIQAEHYRSLAMQLGLIDEDANYVLIAQEKKAPYLTATFSFDPALRQTAAEQIRRAIDLWDRCMALDDWPGFPPTITTLTAPKWADLTEGDTE